MPLAALIPAAIGGVTSIIGGIQGASAAHDAAAAQRQAALAAGKQVTDAASTVNPLIGSAATTAGGLVTDAARTGGLNVIGAGSRAGTSVTGAIRDANANLNPYIDTGHQAMNTLGTMLAPGGDLTKTFDASQMEANDPGYAFRIQQGQLALQRSQAAHGSVQGGGAAKALSDYTQNTASQEYQNAFTRFQQSQQQKYGMLAGTAQMGINPSLAAGSNIMQGTEFGANADIGTSEFAAGGNTNAAQFAGTAGMTAAQIEAQNTMNAAKYSGDTTMGAGNATAAGDINAANSWKGMLGGFSNAAGLYSQLSQPGPTNGGGGFTWTGSPGMGLPPGYAPGLYNPATAGMIP